MKVIRAYPPNFAQIAAAFPIKGMPGIIYAYGDRIYNPSGVSTPAWIMAHEETHGAQQKLGDGYDVKAWWDRYIADPTFRLEQEIPAHRAEWKAYKGFMPDKTYADRIAVRLSSRLYGNLISKERALEEITRCA